METTFKISDVLNLITIIGAFAIQYHLLATKFAERMVKIEVDTENVKKDMCEAKADIKKIEDHIFRRRSDDDHSDLGKQ